VTFKPWHIFVFTLVPLALAFMGVIIGGQRGVGSSAEVFPTQAPAPTSPPTTGTPGGTPGAVTLTLAAKDLKFDKRTLQAPPNTEVTVRMANNDPGVLHNFALYRDRTYRQSVYVGELVTGVTTVDYKFRTPAAGTYYFRCDVHPDTMTGSFTVR
jgi:plastocyanin